MWDYLREAASQYPASLWNLLLDLAPWLFLGLLLAGIVELFLPERKIRSWFGSGKRLAVLRAALLGVPLPLCSCGVVPVALSLRRRGASRGATVSFLITTPQSGLDSIAATWGLMGAPFAILRTILTFVSGVCAGIAVQWLDSEKAENFSPESNFSGEDTSQSIMRRVLDPGWSILLSIGSWLTVGILLAALIDVLIPDQFVSGSVLNGPMGMVVLAVIALPLYVCATASIPLAMEFVDKGFSLGAAFVFLLVGPATNLATALIVRKEIGSRSMWVYLASILLFGLASGWLIDQFLFDISFSRLEHHGHAGFVSQVLAVGLAGILISILFKPFFFKKSQQEFSMAVQKINVLGMTCDHCRRSVEKAVSGVEGVSGVDVNLESGTVQFEGGDGQRVRDAIVAAGYETG